MKQIPSKIEIQRALTVIVGTGNVCELRALGVDGRKRTDGGYFNDFSKAAQAASGCLTSKGVYFVLNAINPDLLARSSNQMAKYAETTTSDKDVIRRRWLYVDCDPVRPSGISSSNDEKNAAIERAEDVRHWLMVRGWYEPIMAMSGNGAHLLFPIDLPNDDDSLKLVKQILTALDAKFSDEIVSVDKSVSNAARICRLYGTVARKGTDTDDRPHRVSKILHVPDYLESGFESIPVATLRAVLEDNPQLPAASRKVAKQTGGLIASDTPPSVTESRLKVPEFLQRMCIEFKENHRGGKETYQIDCPFDPNHKSPDAYVGLMESGAIVFHCSHDSCEGNKWQQFKEHVGVPLPEEFDPPLSAPVGESKPPKKFETIRLGQKKDKQKQTDQTVTTLKESTLKFADQLSEPQVQLMELGIGDLDSAMGGGMAPGELLLMAARPSHGKSMVALQAIHKLTASGVTCCFMSEEMSAQSLSKRTALYATQSKEETWQKQQEQFKMDLNVHFSHRAECYIMESSRTTERMCDNIRRLQDEHGVQCAVVDYAQLLQGEGGNRYEQVTNTSIALRHLATETGISLIVLCQMSRAIEGRGSFTPQMGDLKDSGQLEQDADVLIYLVWPHRLDPNKPEDEYVMYVNKNRNREIKRGMVTCSIDPSRQRINAAAMPWESAADAFR